QEPQWTEDGKMSAAFARHREDLFAAKVGAAGESPTSWAEENYELNGGDQITAGDITGARAAFSAIQKQGVGKGKTSTASWFSLGPKNAIYPAFLNRHGSQYVTSGRITALAIAPTCTLNTCTLWVAAAGGGVWRTDKALGGGNWVNVSDGFFQSGAIGALTYDAAHSTLYAGTGEDAADGGANFTLAQPTTVVLGPNPGQTFPSSFGSTRGATALAVDPTHAGVIYATAYQKGVWRSTDNGATWTNIHASLIGSSADRSEFAVATTPDGHTR